MTTNADFVKLSTANHMKFRNLQAAFETKDCNSEGAIGYTSLQVAVWVSARGTNLAV